MGRNPSTTKGGGRSSGGGKACHGQSPSPSKASHDEEGGDEGVICSSYPPRSTPNRSQPPASSAGRARATGGERRARRTHSVDRSAFADSASEEADAHTDAGVFGEMDVEPFCPPPFPTASDSQDGMLALPRELLRLCLGYLRAWDLAALAMTAAHFYDYDRIDQVAAPMFELMGGMPAGATDRGVGGLLEALRYQEVQYVHKLLSAPEPLNGSSGYWVSKSWATNHRKFAELMATRRKSMLSSHSHKGRRSSVRERRESDAMPPWPDVNADITCEHGCLRPHGKQGPGGSLGKRRVVEKRVWRAIRRLYPQARAFKTSAEECLDCNRKDREEKDRLEEEKRLRDAERTASSAVERLYHRRTGAPTAHGAAPLDPGLYHLVPRCWLSQWRAYLRDPKAPRPRAPECALVLCEAHGLPLPPPHVTDFLSGATGGRGLLSNLTQRSGVVCEIVTPDEWDALTKIYPTDFSLKFSVDPEDLSVAWSTAPCQRCDPCGYDHSQVTVRNRQRSWL